ncbi:hypothetical protein BDQ17DRAFT_1428023 [Cyathus striatus]|nr:hypothetical protein BDQ17DRAFT_1428023 [Cyathus striatus]
MSYAADIIRSSVSPPLGWLSSDTLSSTSANKPSRDFEPDVIQSIIESQVELRDMDLVDRSNIDPLSLQDDDLPQEKMLYQHVLEKQRLANRFERTKLALDLVAGRAKLAADCAVNAVNIAEIAKKQGSMSCLSMHQDTAVERAQIAQRAIEIATLADHQLDIDNITHIEPQHDALAEYNDAYHNESDEGEDNPEDDSEPSGSTYGPM